MEKQKNTLLSSQLLLKRQPWPGRFAACNQWLNRYIQAMALQCQLVVRANIHDGNVVRERHRQDAGPLQPTPQLGFTYRSDPGGGSFSTAQKIPRSAIARTNSVKSTGLTTYALTPSS
jgi:hypothetical protein